MDKQDAEFSAKLQSIFKIEAKEHLEAITKGLLELESDPKSKDTPDVVEKVFREAHSLKGAARAVNMVSIQSICQELENVLSSWRKNESEPTPTLFTVLYRIVDGLQAEIQGEKKQSETFLTELVKELRKAQESKEYVSSPSKAMPLQKNAEPTEQHPHPNGKMSGDTIRISIQKLDDLFHRIEELLVVKLNAQELKLDAQNLLEIFLEWKKDNYLESQNELFKHLLERINKLTIKAGREEHYISSMVDALLDATKQARMQPFSTMLEAFPRMVRDLAHTLNKDVHLELVNCDIEVDRRILEELKDPLTHLIRNSIDHGIESKEERLSKGKPTTGEVKITLSKVGGSVVEILVSDDGRGIDIQKVRDAAIKQGAISSQEATSLNEKEVVNLIFRSGISTSPIITDLSGRGIGVGIVQEKVEKLGGHVKIETIPGAGTTFKLVVPLTLATFRGILITVGKQDFVIPITNVIKVQRIERSQIKIIEGRLSIMWRDKYLPFAFLGEILHIPQETTKTPMVPTMIMRAGDSTVAVGVDAILKESEVFAKNLGSHLKRVKNIAAATVLEGGKVLPILDSYDIVKSALTAAQPKTVQAQEETTSKAKKKRILVVEDSVTTRVLLKNILESRGYEVKISVDGQEALTYMQGAEKFDLILSDVEMPRMTGFELLEKIRAVDKFKELPFILCTTRGSKEDLMHGIQLGANAYIDKSNFTQSNLLDIIEKLI